MNNTRFETGQRVRYILKSGVERVAQIVKRPDSDQEPYRVTLYVFLDTAHDRAGVDYDGPPMQHGTLLQLAVPYSHKPEPGTWYFAES